MKVYLRFVGALALKTGGNKIEFELPTSSTLAEAIRQVFKTYKLGKTKISETGVNSGVVRIFLNGRIMSTSKVLREGDEISFLPPLVGG